jgi:hypothetical protein
MLIIRTSLRIFLQTSHDSHIFPAKNAIIFSSVRKISKKLPVRIPGHPDDYRGWALIQVQALGN